MPAASQKCISVTTASVLLTQITHTATQAVEIPEPAWVCHLLRGKT